MASSPPPSFSLGRRWSIGFSVLLSVLAALALAGMLNYLASRHFWRFPLSWTARTELAPLTQRVLGSLTNDVNVVVFFNPREPLYDSVWNLLKEYKFANRKLRVETVDYESDPARAQLVKAKYQLASPADKNVVIFDCPGRPPRLVYASELSDFDVQPLMSGQSQEVRRTNFKGEMLFTSALVGVLNPRPLKAYFLLGHDEGRPDNDSDKTGFSKFAAVLRENNITAELLPNLFGQREIAADCNLLIIAGPRDAFLPEELDKLDRYLKQGGRLLVLLRSIDSEKPLGLEQLLAGWGVSVGQNFVIDAENSDRTYNMVVNHIGTHAVMKPLYQSSGLYLSMPRSVGKLARTANPDALQVEVLALTGPKGQVLTEFRPGSPSQSSNNSITNQPLMVAVEKGSLPGVSAARGATRIIVTGDAMFLSNEGIDKLANREFAYHAVNWLLARNELLAALGPRPVREYKLIVTQSQMQTLYWTLLLGMPGGVLLLGGLVWLRRQKW